MSTEKLLESYSFGELLALQDTFKTNIDNFYTDHSQLEKQVDTLTEQLKPKQDQLALLKYQHDLHQEQLLKINSLIAERQKEILVK